MNIELLKKYFGDETGKHILHDIQDFPEINIRDILSGTFTLSIYKNAYDIDPFISENANAFIREIEGTWN